MDPEKPDNPWDDKTPNPSEDAESDRRGDPRAPIELKVEYKRLNTFFADYTGNISRGGTFIQTDKPLGLGTEFLFCMVIPELKEPLVLRGRVQWVVKKGSETEDQPAGMGIGFVYETEAQRQKVRNIVEGLMIESLGEVLYRKLMARSEPSAEA